MVRILPAIWGGSALGVDIWCYCLGFDAGSSMYYTRWVKTTGDNNFRVEEA